MRIGPLTGEWVAGMRASADSDQIVDMELAAFAAAGSMQMPLDRTNTTISCILTNARLDKCQCNKLAAIANDGYARGIRPVHTSADGDSIFVMASGEVGVGFDAVAALACECMARAITRSASEAKPAYGLLSAHSYR